MPHRAGVQLTKVFLALRTDFIPGLPTEHITLAYFDEIYWGKLVKAAVKFDRMLPATIILKEAMEWESFEGGAFQGYSIHSPDSPVLDHLPMPHITVPRTIFNDTEPQRDVEVIDRLWLGKKINGHLTWMRVSDKQLGIYHDK